MTNNSKPAEAGAPPLPPMWSKTVFPDAQGIFSSVQEPLDGMKGNSFVVLDANVLLLPYKMGEFSLPEIVKVYTPLAKTGQLVIPPQAAREFAKNRSAKVGEIVKYLREQASLSGPVLSKKIGALEDHEGYKAAKLMIEGVREKVAELGKNILAVADDLAVNVGDDPVSNAYRTLFYKAVCDDPPECDDEAALQKDLSSRYAMSRPPGYKDQNKDDGGAGDLIIWKTILAQGLARKSNCIFVTADQKPDWYVQTGGPFQARPELLEEYRFLTKKTIHIIPLSRLLSVFEASEEIVNEVRNVEIMQINERFSEHYYRASLRQKEVKALEDDLISTEDHIMRLGGYIDSLPDFDGNMSLPWNRAHRQAEGELNQLLIKKEDLIREMEFINPRVFNVHDPDQR